MVPRVGLFSRGHTLTYFRTVMDYFDKNKVLSLFELVVKTITIFRTLVPKTHYDSVTFHPIPTKINQLIPVFYSFIWNVLYDTVVCKYSRQYFHLNCRSSFFFVTCLAIKKPVNIYETDWFLLIIAIFALSVLNFITIMKNSFLSSSFLI